MLQPVQIALDIHDRELEKVVAEDCLNHPEYSIAEEVPAAHEPNIFFLEDRAGRWNSAPHRLASAGDTSKVRIFVVSADASPDKIVEAIKAGASEYFLKPVNPQKIRDAISRVQFQLLGGGKNTGGKAYAFHRQQGRDRDDRSRRQHGGSPGGTDNRNGSLSSISIWRPGTAAFCSTWCRKRRWPTS